MTSLLSGIERFINEKMLPDAYDIATYYSEYYHLGGGYNRLLSYGCFDRYRELGTLYVDPLVYTDGDIDAFDPDRLSEGDEHAWYDGGEPDIRKPGAYSFVKAALYNNRPYEVGPLARQWLCGDYRNGISAMDRIIARVLEAKKIASILQILLQHLVPGVSVQQPYTVPETARGRGLVDTTRGALGHWVSIEDSRIAFYQIITPSVWNLSTQTNGMKGTAEQALIGSPVSNVAAPVEIGRIIRSFDPCVSCATHVYSGGMHRQTIRVV
jgi:hydrogenase large subunit